MNSYFSTDASGKIIKCWVGVADTADRNADGMKYYSGSPPFAATHYIGGGFCTIRTTEEIRIDALMARARLLAASDWTQMPDVQNSAKEAWAAYRQELRDITKQPGWPANVAWPEPPK